MANLGATFTYDETMAPAGREVIPAGTYMAQVTESDVTSTKDGNGQMVKLRWQIMDGQYKGKLIFQNINIVNQSAEAQRIGRAQLNDVQRATRIAAMQDTAQLHNIPVNLKVKVRPARDGYDEQNEVSGVSEWSSTGGAGVGQRPAQAQQGSFTQNQGASPPPPPSGGGHKPW